MSAGAHRGPSPLTPSLGVYTGRLAWVAAVLFGGTIVGLHQGLLLILFVSVGAAVFFYGASRPRSLAVALVIGVVALPEFVCIVVPGLGLLNLQRVANYSAAAVVCWLIVRRDRQLTLLFSLRGLSSSILLGAILLLFGWTLTVVAGALNGPLTLIRALNLVLYEAVPFWIGLRVVGDEDGLTLVSVVLALALCVLVGVWSFELLTRAPAFSWYIPPIETAGGMRGLLSRAGRVRAEASFVHPLNFGQFLLLGLPLALMLATRRGWRLLGALGFLSGLGGLWASGSRSPWLALLAAGVIVFWVRRKAVASLLITAGAASLVLSSSVRDRLWQRVITNPIEGEESAVSTINERLSSVGRVFVVQSSVIAIERRPWRGYGIGRTQELTGIPTIDNHYLRWAAESGVPAAACLMAGLLSLVGAILWVTPRTASLRWLQMAVGIALASYLLELTLVGLGQTLPIFYLIAGIAVSVFGYRGRSVLRSASVTS